jgi:rhamnosyltransferase
MSDRLNPVISVPSDICAVITTYRPDDGFPERVQRIRSQVGLVVIVDDGESADNVARLQIWFSKTMGVILHHNVANVGVAAALNKGVSIAKSQGYRWVLTLDDDTVVEADMVKNLIETWNLAVGQAGKPVAIMGMAYRDRHTGEMEACPADGRPLVEKRGIVTSGSLLPMDVYDRIGPFREEFIIDLVDYDFCLRARAAGFRVVKGCRLGMTHSVGHKLKRRFGWLTLEATNHSPLRRYYAYRNATVLAREHFRRDPLYALAVFVSQLRTLSLVLLMENDRCRKVKLLFYGILDGWRDRLGKLSNERIAVAIAKNG